MVQSMWSQKVRHDLVTEQQHFQQVCEFPVAETLLQVCFSTAEGRI